MMANLRTELEMNVCSVNKMLKETVHTMTPLILLRNLHPSYRENFALKLKDAGLLTREETKEFAKLL